MTNTNNRPSRNELGQLLSVTDLKTCSLLLRSLQATEPLTTEIVTKLAVYDWLTALDALSEVDRQRAILELDLGPFAEAFERCETADPPSAVRPRAAFVLLDFRYVLPPVAVDSVRKFFDLKPAEWITALPYPALTTLACDLSVLLLRLIAKMEHVRKQEIHNATTSATESGRDDGHSAVARE